MTSSDMQVTPGRAPCGRSVGPPSAQPKRRTFTAAYKLEMIGKTTRRPSQARKGRSRRGEGLYDFAYQLLARSAATADTVPGMAHKGRPADGS
jgi:hypothetical protein